MNPSSFSIPLDASAMLRAGDGVAPTDRAAPRSPAGDSDGVGAGDVAVRDGAQASVQRMGIARREMGLMAGEEEKEKGGSRKQKAESRKQKAESRELLQAPSSPRKRGSKFAPSNMDPRLRGDDMGRTCRSCFLLSAF